MIEQIHDPENVFCILNHFTLEMSNTSWKLVYVSRRDTIDIDRLYPFNFVERIEFMKKLQRYLAIVLCMVLFILPIPISQADTVTAAQPEMAFGRKDLVDKELLDAMVSSEDVVPGKLIVKFSDSSAFIRDRVMKSMDMVQSFQTTDAGSVIEVDLIQSADLADTMQIFSSMPEVEFVEPLYVYSVSEDVSQTVAEAVYWPNDTYTQKKWQWGLEAINILDAWERVSEEQRSTQTIAIVDSGVDLDHPDLKENLVEGYDFVNRDSDPDDDNSHGTHVAGIAAGISGNDIGIAGVAGGAKIMPVKVMNADGRGYSLDIYLGILFAVRQGADVINLSLGGSGPSLLIKEAIEFAQQNDVVVVAATGNDYSGTVSYPAAFDGVIAVGAVDWSYSTGFTLAGFSNYGDKIDLVAPGIDILSTIPREKDINDGNQDGYGLKQGTSMATPFVSGMAALLRAEDNSLTASQVQQRLFENAVDIGPERWDMYFGMGIINGSNTKAVPEVIEYPHIGISRTGNNISNLQLTVTAYRGKGVIDTGFSGEITVNVDQTFSEAVSGYLYIYKNPLHKGFNLEKNEAGILETVTQKQIVFDLVNGTCTKKLELADTGYYSFTFANTIPPEDYLLNPGNYLYYIRGNNSEITGAITLDQPYTRDMVVYLYAINEIYAEIMMLGWEGPIALIIPAGQQSVSFSMELPPDTNYKLYYSIMTDNDDYQYFGFYKDTTTSLNPDDFTPIDLTTGDKLDVNLNIVKTADQDDDVSDTKAGAAELNLSGGIASELYSLDYMGDRDYFTFTVPSEGDYVFYLISGFNCRGTLYDSDGKVVDSKIEVMNVHLNPGTYYLKAEGETGLEYGGYILAYGLSEPIEPQLIQFTDNNLKEAIYNYLGIDPEEPLYDYQVQSIEQLNLNGLGISSLNGLEYFYNLLSLELKSNQITDLAPLQSLTMLEVLDLSDNLISDISPLSYLTEIYELDISRNNIAVVPEEFSGFSNLYHLDLGHNAITSVAFLTSMDTMARLFLNDNEISDIQPLSDLDLQILYLAGNPISDFSPVAKYYGTLEDKDFSVPPVASDVIITGNKTPGSVLTGAYTYNSMVGYPESGTTFKWFRSTAQDGDYSEIADANAITYTVTEKDRSHFLKFEVTPRSSGEPQAGIPVKSPAFGPIRSGSVTPQDPGNGGTSGGGSGSGNLTPTPTPAIQPTATPTPVTRVEEDENGRNRLIFEVQEQDIRFDEPPVIDTTSWQGVDSYTLNIPASVFTGSGEHEQPVSIRSEAFLLEIQPGTFNISEETATVTLTMDIYTLSDLPEMKLPDDTDSVSFIFDINVYIDGKPVTSFNKPITITLQMDLAGINNPDKVGMWFFSEAGSKWIYIGGKVNDDGMITFTIPHFTKFAAFEYIGTFTDIESHWAKEDIEIMAARQVTNGTGNGRFSPDTMISRAEFTAMIVRALDISAGSGENPFKDIQSEDWFLDAALKANGAGLIQGDANGYFIPAGMITREELAAIVVRAYCYKTGMNQADIITTQEVRFTDEDKAASWARRTVVLADALGLMNGFTDITFRPKNFSTRAEAIVVIKRLMKLTEIF